MFFRKPDETAAEDKSKDVEDNSKDKKEPKEDKDDTEVELVHFNIIDNQWYGILYDRWIYNISKIIYIYFLTRQMLCESQASNN